MNGIECMNDCLCPRAQPEVIKNFHALNPIHEPRSSVYDGHPSYAIILQIHTFKGVLHPCSVFWLFMHFPQKLQHIGNK